MEFHEVPSGFFNNVKFYVIGDINVEAEKLLFKGGAQRHQYLSDILTHCIADEFNEEIAEAQELFQLNVVKSSWVLKSLECQCLLPVKPFDADFSKNLFTGVIACPAKVNKKDHTLMWGLITSHNGKYKNKYDETITHLITNSTSGAKYDLASKNHVKIISTTWIIDSISNKKRLLESQYHPKHFTVCSTSPLTETSQEALDDKLLDDKLLDSQSDDQSEMLEQLTEVPPPPDDSKSIVDEQLKEASANITGEEETVIPAKAPMEEVNYFGHDPKEIFPADKFLTGCIFHICDYQGDLGKDEISLWGQIIEIHGGLVCFEYSSSNVTHLLCEHQKSITFQQALKDNKRIVTASWLNDCLVEKRMLIPSSVLHIPQPFGKEKPCANEIISVTNFSGAERTQVKKLILLLGAKYSSCMSKVISVLVAKSPSGSKYNKAVEWNLPVVNTDWLIDLALGNLEALRLPILREYADLDCKATLNMQEKLSQLMNGWKIPLKLTKVVKKDFNPLQTELSLLQDFGINKENLVTE